MLKWKRTVMHAGVSLSVVAVGALAAEGAASAHDAADNDGAVAHNGAGHHVVQGLVTTVGADSFTITTHKGATETIDTTSSTTFTEIGTPVAPVTVPVGERVAVTLDPTATTPTAVRVTVLLDRVSGKVVDVSATSLTLSGARSTTRQAMILASTQYFNGKTAATGVTDGEFVTVFGSRDATTPTELDAFFVDIGATSPNPPVGPVVGENHGGPGRGDDHGDNDNDGDRDGDHDGDHGPPVTTTPTTTSVTTPPAPVGEPGDPDHAGFPGAGDQDNGDQDGNSGPGNQGDQDHGGGNGGGQNGGDNGGGGSSGGSGSGGHGGGH
jgi:uncharacterized membrane protein YgcG